ncbi:hypothetical protein Q1W73_06275 [Asticcacaulis sp. ZE23SCel15]|uniref:hypothetical protein n=1 Tax=Asticcacaulis sp. ZE23SCel15 TaxID=3059027 RepID=UPI00265DF351|nr:hypothetical protein [Asticcacaulis sp. ZE23SCel15]WKL58588.1 hypothetical protein Q1W73_06275 [Asticcacaulis sp. ZE23SCel15]
MTPVSILCLLILIYGLTRPPSFLLITALVYTSFGALALIPPALTAGASILAAPVAFLFLIGKLLWMQKTAQIYTRTLVNPSRVGILGLFTVVAVVGAFILPSLFAGEMYVIPMRLATSYSYALTPLYPTTSNITQSLYLIISFMIVTAMATMARLPDFKETFTKAILYAMIAAIATGMIDFVFGIAGKTDMLKIFRNASYAMLVDQEVSGGVRRTVGLMPEASSYGTLVIALLGPLLFMRQLYSPKMTKWVVMPAIGLGFLFAALSTSSTAYVGIIVIVGLHFADSIHKAINGDMALRARVAKELGVISILGLLGFIGLMALPATRELIFTLVDEMLLNKTQSLSYIERSSWNTYALQNFWDTKGFGVGAGSVRTSNFFVNILAATGFIGALLFAIFLIQLISARVRPEQKELKVILHGAKLSVLPVLVCASLVGTTPDYGIFVACLFGVIAGTKYVVPPRVVGHIHRPSETEDVQTS